VTSDMIYHAVFLLTALNIYTLCDVIHYSLKVNVKDQ